MIGERNKPIPISPTAIIKLQGNHTNNFTAPAFSIDLVYNAGIISYLSDNGIASDSYRYWKLYIEDKGNGNGYISIGAFMLGNYWNPVRCRPQFPLKKDFIDLSSTVFSEGGQSYSDIKEQTESYNIEMTGLTIVDEEYFWNIYNKFGKSKPFFIAMDSNLAFSSDSKIKFVKFKDDPSEVLVRPNNFSISFQVREEL
jgi:hypothetical protein